MHPHAADTPDTADTAEAIEATGIPWAECQGAGDYPTLLIDFDVSQRQQWTRLFFDTGARHNYIARSLLDELRVPVEGTYFREHKRDIGPARRMLTAEARRHLTSYYSDETLQVTISDNFFSYSGSVAFRVVEDWELSTFAALCAYGECLGSSQIGRRAYRCGYRRGLLSAAALHQLGVEATVVGSTRSTILKTSS
jgi:hypothetical protein